MENPNPTLHLEVSLRASSQVEPKLFKWSLREGQEYSIGREGAWLTLNDESISRVHAVFFVEEGKLVLKDQGSRNGTFLNQDRVEEAEVQVGDTVLIGSFRITIRAIRGEGEESGHSSSGGSRDSMDSKGSMGSGDPMSLEYWKQQGRKVFDQYRMAVVSPNDFFDQIDLSFVWQKSALILAAIGAANALFHAILSSHFALALGTLVLGVFVMWVAGIGFALVFHLFRGFLSAQGGFSEYLHFAVYPAALTVPLAILIGVFESLSGLAAIAVSMWCYYGYYRVFKPDLKNYLILCLGFTMAAGIFFGAILYSILLARVS